MDDIIQQVFENIRASGTGKELEDLLEVANDNFYGNGSLKG
jgi:hypothetical protein